MHDLAHKSWGVFRDDRMLQMAKYHFDFSVSEIFVPLYVGATLYISQVQLLPGPQFVDLLNRLGMFSLLSCGVLCCCVEVCGVLLCCA